MNDRLSGISVFVQAVEAGSFAGAADRLQLSRSAVGKSIGRLEARLGVRLFQRTTRSQRLTDDGQAFYERCLRALAELEAGEAALDDGRRVPSGRLRITAPVLFGRRCAAQVLLPLPRQYPQLSLEMSFTDRVVDLVEEGIDLGIRVGPLPDSSDLVARRLGSQKMAVCGSPGYLAKHGRPQTQEDLSEHIGIRYSRAGRSKPWRFPQPDGALREVSVPCQLMFDDLEAIVGAAIAGCGLAWVPRWLIADAVRDGQLEQVLEDVPPFGFEIHAVWPQSRYLPSRVRAAIDLLAVRIPEILNAGMPGQPEPPFWMKAPVMPSNTVADTA